MTDAFYSRDGDRLVSSELTRGPWDPGSQHAGPPAALLARALERCEAREAATELDFFDTGRPGSHTAMEIRFARGAFEEPGPATVWMRPRAELVAGEPITPLQRVMPAADGGNGVSAPVDWSRFIFVDADLTVHLLRPPAGDWICLDSVTQVDGIGLTDTALWDERRRIGRPAQTLLVRPRG